MSLDSILRSVGKNLLNSNNISSVQFCTVVSKGDGGAVITSPNNKENTASVAYLLRVTLPAGTYTFSCNFTIENTKNSTRPNEIMIFVDNKFITLWNLAKFDGTYAPTKTFTTDKESEIKISWYFNAAEYTTADTIAKVTFSNLQLEKSSTATAYEPYHQGPESIEIGDKEVLKISYGSRNLFDISSSVGFQSIYQGVTSTISDTTITTSSTANRSCYLLLGYFSAGTHTISFSNTDFSLLMLSYGEALGQLSRLDSVNFVSSKSHTFTLAQPVKLLWLESTISTNQTRTITDIQLELGNKATEYVPYSREVVWQSN